MIERENATFMRGLTDARRWGSSLAVALALACPAHQAAAQGVPAPPPASTRTTTGTSATSGAKAESVDDALRQMVELEAELEAAQRRQFERAGELQRVGTALDAAEHSARAQQDTAAQGEAFLRRFDEQLGKDQAQFEQTLAQGREQIAQQRAALRLARLALLAQAGRPEGPGRETLPLALLDESARTQAGITAARMLRAESRLAQLSSERSEAHAAAGYHGAFSELSARQLRERHKQLAEQVATLRTGLDEAAESVTALATRRGELGALIERLSEEQERAEAEARATQPRETPTLAATPGSEPTTQGPAAQPPPGEPPQSPGSGAQLPEVGYEAGSEPLVTKETAAAGATGSFSAIGDHDEAGATRQLFWRASPIGVRAVVAGRVLFSGEVAGYRHLLIIDHGQGWRTLYGNMTESALVRDQVVDAGALIGKYQAGQGRRAEAFFFEVYQGTKPVAPGEFPSLPDGWQERLFQTTQ